MKSKSMSDFLYWNKKILFVLFRIEIKKIYLDRTKDSFVRNCPLLKKTVERDLSKIIIQAVCNLLALKMNIHLGAAILQPISQKFSFLSVTMSWHFLSLVPFSPPSLLLETTCKTGDISVFPSLR